MTPEKEQQFDEMYAWFKDRQAQQLEYPLDLVSQKLILAPYTQKITAGAPYTNDGVITVTIGGVKYTLMTTASP